jgi:hypothetical protein
MRPKAYGLSVLPLMLGGCISAPVPQPEPIAPTPAPALPVASSEPATPSTLTYGMVTSQVKKGVTRQLDLVQLFGAPNISTYDSAGVESWVYERTVTQTDVQSNSKVVQGAANLGLFFNYGQVGGGVAGNQASGATTMTASVRSITVIVKFAPNKTVSDYSVRASYF